MLNSTKNVTINTSNVAPIGSHDDVYSRLTQQLPRWWGTDHINLDTVLEAYITTAVLIYSQLIYVQAQTRLQTATDNNLDLISQDYLGSQLPRRQGENDDSYRNRISATLLQEKATRPGLQNALYLLTGIEPVLFEPWNSQDAGCCNVNAYCNITLCGSGSYPYQGFADVYVSAYLGMAGYGGCNNTPLACNIINSAAANWCGGESLLTITVSDDDIYQLIELTKVFGTIVWTRIIRN